MLVGLRGRKITSSVPGFHSTHLARLDHVAPHAMGVAEEAAGTVMLLGERISRRAFRK